MITSEKLDIYKRFDGDIDGFARGGSKKDCAKISDQEWTQIDRMVSALKIINEGLASESFKEEKNKELEALAPDPEVQNRLRNYFEDLEKEKKISKINYARYFIFSALGLLVISLIINILKK